MGVVMSGILFGFTLVIQARSGSRIFEGGELIGEKLAMPSYLFDHIPTNVHSPHSVQSTRTNC